MIENKKTKKDFEKSINFLEDLCWLLDSGKKNNYNEIIKIIKDIKSNQNFSVVNANHFENKADTLIGILPKLLTDTTLFDTNRALAQFSNEILGIDILNWHKRSRNEMIGVIICKVQASPEVRNGISAYLLSDILENKEKIKKLQKETENSNNQFLWNDAIHKIVGEISNE